MHTLLLDSGISLERQVYRVLSFLCQTRGLRFRLGSTLYFYMVSSVHLTTYLLEYPRNANCISNTVCNSEVALRDLLTVKG